ncbi:hypothetical protein ACJX0J_037402, partial [Zea mays]
LLIIFTPQNIIWDHFGIVIIDILLISPHYGIGSHVKLNYKMSLMLRYLSEKMVSSICMIEWMTNLLGSQNGKLLNLHFQNIKDALSKYGTRLETSLGIWAFDELCPKHAKMTPTTIQKELAICYVEAIITHMLIIFIAFLKILYLGLSQCGIHLLALCFREDEKDKNFVQAMFLVVDVKTCLINLRSEGWEPLFEETKIFCLENYIPIPNMEDKVPRFGRSRKGGGKNITQEHYFR